MNGAHVALVGRVTRAGELKYASTGTAMLRVGVLVEDTKQRDGDPPNFADVVIWGERAEELADKLPKGASVYIEGKVKAKSWTGSDGTVRASLDVSAWKAEPMGQIGRNAPQRPRQTDQRRPNAMPERMAVVGARDTRQQIGLDDDFDPYGRAS